MTSISTQRDRDTHGLPEQKVLMGEMQVVRGAFRLRTLLGSCVGLMLYDLGTGVGGLAHIVLPRSHGQDAAPGKYADTAIPEMLRKIERLNGRVKHLSGKMTGGANMFASKGLQSIGDQNIAAIELILKTEGIPILGRDCGGNSGRRLTFDVDTGRARVEVFGSPVVEL